MQQLVIKLSPEATRDYLNIARGTAKSEQRHDRDTTGVQLDINMALISGLCFADIGVNGQRIGKDSDSDDLQVELIELDA